MQMTSKSPTAIGIIWIVLFCLIAGIIGKIIDAPRLWLLQREHRETLGEVMRLVPQSHGLVEVRYLVDGDAYQRSFEPHLGSQLIAEGDSVLVYYSPHHPENASIYPPADILTEELPPWLLGSFLLSVGIAAAIFTVSRPSPLLALTNRFVSPKLVSAGITVGVFGGVALSLFWGRLRLVKLLPASLILCGCVIFLTLAWERKLNWADLLRSRKFWIALGLAILGNTVDALLS
jgi:hypothetical protein